MQERLSRRELCLARLIASKFAPREALLQVPEYGRPLAGDAHQHAEHGVIKVINFVAGEAAAFINFHIKALAMTLGIEPDAGLHMHVAGLVELQGAFQFRNLAVIGAEDLAAAQVDRHRLALVADGLTPGLVVKLAILCLLYTSDAADE